MRLMVYPTYRDYSDCLQVHGVFVDVYYPFLSSLYDYLPSYIPRPSELQLSRNRTAFFIPDSVIPSFGSRPPYLVVYDAFSLAHVDLLQSASEINNNQTNRK